MDAEQFGLAAYVVMNHLLNELEKSDPGLKERVKNAAVEGMNNSSGPNQANIIQAIKLMN